MIIILIDFMITSIMYFVARKLCAGSWKLPKPWTREDRAMCLVVAVLWPIGIPFCAVLTRPWDEPAKW